MKKGIFLVPLACTFSISAVADENNYQIHILKPGETLSEILYSKNYKPLYGKENWVEKVLEMNHLSKEDAPKIKKGYPVILPQDSEIASLEAEHLKTTDKVSTGLASTIKYGLLGNKISKHQSVFLDFSHSRKESKMSSTTVTQNENFSLGLTVKDKNIRTAGKFQWNPTFKLGVESHGSAEFSNNDSFSASHGPTWNIETAVELKHASLDYKFAPFINLQESSHLDEDDNNFEVRRDRFVSLGMKAFQTYERSNLIFNFGASISSSLISQNLKNKKAMHLLNSKVEADINLTQDYFIGAYFQRELFTGSNLNSANTIGLNLKYFIN